ncbi:MAG: VWA domain-containing protein [Kiritimatiellia bacterium]
MRFAEPFGLLLLLLVPLLGLAMRMWQRRAAERLKRLSRYAVAVPPRSRVQAALLLFAFTFLILAWAHPQWGKKAEEISSRGRNLMLAVDVSRSMLAEDVYPNRLGRAKADLIDLVDELKGDRAGLLAFRKKAVLLCPMTTDYAYLRQSIDALAPDVAPKGATDVADAIEKSLAAFELAKSTHNAIVLISDGEDLAGRAKALAQEAGKRNIPIFTIGLGSVAGAVVPGENQTVTVYQGNTVKSCLTEATLREISEASGGRYVSLATAGTAQTTLGAVYARYLTKLADQEQLERMEMKLVDRTGLFCLIGVSLALIAGLLSLGRIGRVLVVLLIALPLGAQELARDAQADYRAGNYVEAAAGYANARASAEPSEAARYAYNEALAFWKAGDVTNALATLRLAVTDRTLTARAATLEGTLLMGQASAEEALQKRLALREEAIVAFSRALQAEPSEVAQRNLFRAKEGLETLRRDAHRAAVLKQYEGKPLGQMIPEVLTHQRALMKSVPEVFSSPNPNVRIDLATRLAKDVRTQEDRWIPILEQLPTVITNETLCTELQTRTRQAQAALATAASRFEELTADTRILVEGEPFAYDFWKTFADPPALNREAINVQTNALTSSVRYMETREDEPEVLNLVQQFRALFPQWAEDQLKQQAASTNEVTFTEADRDVIASTAEKTVPLLAPPVSDENKRKVMENLLLIRQHLPPQKQDSQQPQNQNQQSSDPSQSQPKEAPPQQPKDEPKRSEQPSKEQQEASQKKEESQALLQKAADREREHEEEKRRRAERFQLPTDERDW